MNLSISISALRRALQKEGFHRRVIRKKPPISEKNARLRLAWAIEHVNWTREQWNLILWTDETWVIDGRYKRYVWKYLILSIVCTNNSLVFGSHEGLARRTILYILMKKRNIERDGCFGHVSQVV